MIGVAIDLALEHMHVAGAVLDGLLVADIMRRVARWLIPRCRDRWEQIDDDLRRRLER